MARRRGLPAALLPLVGSTGVVLVSGLASAKAAAVFLGPEGVGRLAIAQAVVLVVAVLATISLPEALVRFTASRLGRGEAVGLQRGRRVAAQLTVAAGAVVAVVAVVAHGPLNRLLFPGVGGPALLAGSVVGGLLYAAASMVLALPTAQRRTDLFALGNSLGAASTPVVSTAGFWWLGIDGLAPVLVLSNVCSLGAALFAVRRLTLAGEAGPPPEGERAVVRELLRFGVPQMLFHLTALSFVLITPLLAQRALGTEDSGLFRAAFTLSSAAGLLLSFVIGQELFPRLSALTHRPEAFAASVNQGVRVVALGGGALVAVGMGGAPIILDVLFTGRFVGAADLLRWLLVSELVRLVGLVWTTAVSVHRGTALRLVSGVVASVGSALATMWLLEVRGLEGAGLGPALGQGVAMVFAGVVVLRCTPVRLNRPTLAALGAEAAVLSGLFAATTSLGPLWQALCTVVALAVLGGLGARDTLALFARRAADETDADAGVAALAVGGAERAAGALPMAPRRAGRVSPPWPAVVLDAEGGVELVLDPIENPGVLQP